MIKNIVFDVDKVLVSYDPEKMMRNLGFTEEAIEHVNHAMFHHPLWNISDQGLFTPDEFRAKFMANDPNYAKEILAAYNAVGDAISLYPYVENWMKMLKTSGYHLYILSNYAEYTYEVTKHKMKFLPYMYGVVFSYQCQLIKPDPAIYHYLLDNWQLNPAETVFLDDRAENIIAAKEKGIHGIVFTTYEDASEKLFNLLKNC